MLHKSSETRSCIIYTRSVSLKTFFLRPDCVAGTFWVRASERNKHGFKLRLVFALKTIMVFFNFSFSKTLSFYRIPHQTSDMPLSKASMELLLSDLSLWFFAGISICICTRGILFYQTQWLICKIKILLPKNWRDLAPYHTFVRYFPAF